jgi:LCP family protein required for cell wall assembly
MTRRILRTAVLALVLAVVALVVPNSGVAPTYITLVKFEHTAGVDTDPDVIWILAVGSDARRGQDPLHSRGDTLQLVGMDTRTGAATSIGIPRDSWVSIPGYGSNRINAALYFGGPQLMGEAVAGLIGIEPDYVFVTTFWGVEQIAKDIGPITVDNPIAFSDQYLKPKGFPAGKVVLKGYNVVSFGRIRKTLAGGDFDRSANQQRVLEGFQAKVADNADKAGWIENGVLSVMDNVDTDLDPAELFEIAQAVAQVDPKKISGCVVPGGIGNIGGASVVLPYTDTAKRYGDDARNDASIKRC